MKNLQPKRQKLEIEICYIEKACLGRLLVECMTSSRYVGDKASLRLFHVRRRNVCFRPSHNSFLPKVVKFSAEGGTVYLADNVLCFEIITS